MVDNAQLEQEGATWIAMLAAVATNTAATYRAAVRSFLDAPVAVAWSLSGCHHGRCTPLHAQIGQRRLVAGRSTATPCRRRRGRVPPTSPPRAPPTEPCPSGSPLGYRRIRTRINPTTPAASR